tara:strand:+ start:415 stop:1551 length:1137 start_codon:yes stop_codon:yes gene_type:complete
MRCQKTKFILSKKVTYLNCAYMSPMLKKVEKAGVKGIKQKRKPYHITPIDFFKTSDLVKKRFSSIIDCKNHNRIAIIPSASYGLANVVNNISIKEKDEIILLDEQFPSNVYPWLNLKERSKAKLVFIKRPDTLIDSGKKWNEEILAAITNKTKVVAIGNIHWACGTLFDLIAIRKKTAEVGALLIIDGTQSIGALPLSIEKIQPDALICAGYKWLMGPYSIGVAYYGNYFDKGIPIEDNWINRRGSENFSGLINYSDKYGELASRYNVGEQSNFILLPMLLAGLNQIESWGVKNIQDYCKNLISEEIKKVNQKKYWIEKENYRANHLFGIKQLDNKINLIEKLKSKKISVSIRGDKIRVSPHVYNDKREIKKLFECLT